MIIRDYGTHFITETENGANIVQVSYLNEKCRKMSREIKTSISKGAAVFFSMGLNFTLGFRSEDKDSKLHVENYMKVVESRFQTTHGGAPISFGENSFDEWQRSVLHNMVAVDRVGRPIYEAINAIKLPELEPSLLKKVVEVLKSAVHRYYEANIVLGCMDPDSPVFDPNANAPSTTACSVSEASFFKKGQIFGGTYQTCYGLDGKISDAYYFGGIFSDTFVNPVTGDKSCPDNFESLRLGKGLNLCASVDWKSGIAESVPFGGLYACQSGNPMTPLIENYKNSTTRSGNQIMFKSVSNSILAPKRCPSGYVSHSAGLEDVCQISYCMPSDTFKNERVQLIKSPPFIKLVSLLSIKCPKIQKYRLIRRYFVTVLQFTPIYTRAADRCKLSGNNVEKSNILLKLNHVAQ
ncbi:macrophage expressed 1 [Cichlidogyrus casuarinus]|uniref:Macrophage expressed 1 n=1 Tax=Cichlidogyrus casuarinus TaxID=1844966 RepID=A0ABD2Q9B9_9PLAT